MKSSRKLFFLTLCLTLLVMGLGNISKSSAKDNSNNRVKASQLAKFQTEASKLAALWVTYAFGNLNFNPTIEEGDVSCTDNQPNPSKVIILTGTFGEETIRRCTVPHNKPLFFPARNCNFFNLQIDDAPCSTNVDCKELEEEFGYAVECGPNGYCIEKATVYEKINICEESVDKHCGMKIFLDDKQIYPSTNGGIPLLRTASSPEFGCVPVIFGGDENACDPELISNGHWALISPQQLSKGEHMLRFTSGRRGEDGVCSGEKGVTYYLTVVGHDDDDDDN